MNTLLDTARRPALGIRATSTAPVVIATDGHAQSDGAFALARMLVNDEQAVRVVSALRSRPIVPDVGAVMTSDIDQALRAELHRGVLEQTSRFFSSPIPVAIHD